MIFQLVGYVGGIIAASYITGVMILGKWWPWFLPDKQYQPAYEMAPAAETRQEPDTGTFLPWEEPDFYAEPIHASVTDAKPSRWRRWRDRNDADVEAETFVSEITDAGQDVEYPLTHPAQVGEIHTVDDIRRWSETMTLWIQSWGTEEEEKVPALPPGTPVS